MFKQAVKHEAKLRLAIAGPSGSGKTYTALAVGTALGKTAVVDTEHGSASKYADIFNFDTLHLSAPFHPDRFTEAIQAAGQGGYDVIILDSLSHAWNGSGGALELVEQFSRKYKGNSYAAWGDVTPIQNRLIESIVGADIHVIATMRSKQDYILVEGKNGKTAPQKVGMAPIQRDGFEYEFDVFLDMDIDNNGVVSKTRCSALTGQVISKPGEQLANTLKEWLVGEPTPVRDEAENDNDNGREMNEYEARVWASSKPKDFFAAASDWIGIDPDEAKKILKALGHEKLSKNADGRIEQLREIYKAVHSKPEQEPLSPDAETAVGGYEEA